MGVVTLGVTFGGSLFDAKWEVLDDATIIKTHIINLQRNKIIIPGYFLLLEIIDFNINLTCKKLILLFMLFSGNW